MLRLISRIPRSHAQCKITFPPLDLREPGHITSRRSKIPVKNNIAKLRLPCIRDHEPLLKIQQRVPVVFLLFERHLPRPVYMLHLKPFFTDRDPFKINISRRPLYPNVSLKRIRNLHIPNAESLISAPDPPSDPILHLHMRNGCGVLEFQPSPLILQARHIRCIPFPDRLSSA